MKSIMVFLIILLTFELIVQTNAQGPSAAIAVYLNRYKERKQQEILRHQLNRLHKKYQQKYRAQHGRRNQVLCDGRPCFDDSF